MRMSWFLDISKSVRSYLIAQVLGVFVTLGKEKSLNKEGKLNFPKSQLDGDHKSDEFDLNKLK